MPSFSDYFIGCDPGKGQLINGQWYRSRFGKETLQMMVNDGCFQDPPDADVDILQADIDNLNDELAEVRDMRMAWELYADACCKFITEKGLTPPELPEELAEED